MRLELLLAACAASPAACAASMADAAPLPDQPGGGDAGRAMMFGGFGLPAIVRPHTHAFSS